MAISRDDVLRIAALARLSLGEDEADALTRQLDEILAYVNRLRGLDTEGVPPMAGVVEMPTPMRDDEPRPSLPREAALANAPRQADGVFVVPKTV